MNKKSRRLPTANRLSVQMTARKVAAAMRFSLDSNKNGDDTG